MTIDMTFIIFLELLDKNPLEIQKKNIENAATPKRPFKLSLD